MWRAWSLLGLILALVGSITFARIQTIRANHLADMNHDLESRIIRIKIEQALTDQLRKANAILNNDQQDIRNDLRDAKGYSDPLSSDVIGILVRLR